MHKKPTSLRKLRMTLRNRKISSNRFFQQKMRGPADDIFSTLGRSSRLCRLMCGVLGHADTVLRVFAALPLLPAERENGGTAAKTKSRFPVRRASPLIDGQSPEKIIFRSSLI